MLAVFLDLETSGLDPTKHRVLEVALCIYALDEQKLLASYSTLVSQPEEIWNQADKASLEVNGLSQSCYRNAPTEAQVSEQIIRLFQEHQILRGKAVFIAQNSSFDRAFFGQLVHVYQQEEMHWPYHWLDLASMHWARSDHLAPEFSLSKNAIAQSHGIAPEASPHVAMNGVIHLVQCYNAVIGAALPTSEPMTGRPSQ